MVGYFLPSQSCERMAPRQLLEGWLPFESPLQLVGEIFAQTIIEGNVLCVIAGDKAGVISEKAPRIGIADVWFRAEGVQFSHYQLDQTIAHHAQVFQLPKSQVAFRGVGL